MTSEVLSDRSTSLSRAFSLSPSPALRRLLLGFLLRSSDGAADGLTADDHLDVEALAVIRAFGRARR